MFGMSYQGPMPIGQNSGNSLQLLIQRLLAMRQQGAGQASPGADAAMASLLGLTRQPANGGVGGLYGRAATAQLGNKAQIMAATPRPTGPYQTAQDMAITGRRGIGLGAY